MIVKGEIEDLKKQNLTLKEHINRNIEKDKQNQIKIQLLQ